NIPYFSSQIFGHSTFTTRRKAVYSNDYLFHLFTHVICDTNIYDKPRSAFRYTQKLSTFHSQSVPLRVGLSVAIFLASQARQPRIFATIPNARADFATNTAKQFSLNIAVEYRNYASGIPAYASTIRE
ncbi:hypothetical protein EZS27_044253, partial [termite gut metagenome]